MKKKLLALTLCCMLTSTLFGCGTKTQTEAPPDLLEPVKSSSSPREYTVARMELYDPMIIPAVVVPKITEVGFSHAGTFSRFAVEIGDEVKQGDLLAVCDETMINERIKNMNKQISNLNDSYTRQKQVNADNTAIFQSKLNWAKKQLEGLKGQEYSAKCYEIGLLDQSVKRTALADKQTDEMFNLQSSQLKKRLNKLKTEAGNAFLYAPCDGIVCAMANLSDGSRVDDTTLAVALADNSKLHLQTEYLAPTKFKTSDFYYVLVHGKRYEITNVPFSVEEYNKLAKKGESPVSTYTFNQIDDKVLLGDEAQLILVKNYRKDALAVPVDSIYTEGSTRFVYKIVNGKQIRTEITIGTTDGNFREVLTGLQEGDVVYVAN